MTIGNPIGLTFIVNPPLFQPLTQSFVLDGFRWKPLWCASADVRCIYWAHQLYWARSRQCPQSGLWTHRQLKLERWRSTNIKEPVQTSPVHSVDVIVCRFNWFWKWFPENQLRTDEPLIGQTRLHLDCQSPRRRAGCCPMLNRRPVQGRTSGT